MDREDPDFDLAALELGQPPLEVAPRRPVTPAESRAPAPPAPDAAPREEGDAPSPAAEVGEAAGAPPPRTPPPPATPADLRGLSASAAAARAGRGLGNVDRSRQRSDREIIRGNLLTYFNIVLGSLIVALFVLAAVEQEVGKFQDALFVGIVVAANVSIGTFQEIRAARTLRQLAALAAPRATVVRDGQPEAVRSDEVVQGDLILLKPGDQVVADGPVIDGAAEIDESLLTGESESVRKTVGDSLLSGSFSAGGHCYYRAAQVGVDAYAMRLTADAQQLVRRATPLQVRFRRMLRLLLIATAVLGAMLLISEGVSEDNFGDAITFTAAAITSIVPDGLLLAMTVAFTVGAVRVGRAGAIVQDIAAVEALNYVDVICLDKTGTITANALTFRQAHWARGGAALQPWLGGFAAAMARENRTAQALAVAMEASSNGARAEERVPFTSARRWSAARLVQGGEQRTFVLGAPETVLPACDNGGELESDLRAATALGLRAVIFAEAPDLPDPDERLDALHAVALLTLADSLRPEITQAFTTMTELGIEPKVISGDNPETVVALLRQLRIRLPGGAIAGPALEALDAEGFARAAQEHSIFGRIAPQQKARIVAALREGGHFVAMVGDGANDVRALREADVAVAMESGAGTARAVSGIVLRNDSFHALVQGTAIAQRVLGRSAQLSKLYITKSFYAYMIIVASNMLGLDFPFLPRHGGLTALLTLGIPAVFISLTVPPPAAGKDFTNNVLRFALPASLALAAAAVAVHLLTEGFIGRPVEDSRTLITLTIGIVGLVFMVQVIGFEGATRYRPLRPLLVSGFGALLFALFLGVIYTPWLRDFFDFGPVDADEWAIIIVAVAAAIGGQYAISRYWREILRWITRPPAAHDVARGRSP